MENDKIKDSFLNNGFVVVPKLFDEETISIAKNLLGDFDYSKIPDVVFDEGGKLPKYWQGINSYIKYFNRFFSSKLLNTAKILLDQESPAGLSRSRRDRRISAAGESANAVMRSGRCWID